MGIQIEKEDHLYFFNSNERESEAIERLFVGCFGIEQDIYLIKQSLGIMSRSHVVITGIDISRLTRDVRVQGDLDVIILPCSVEKYVNGVGDIEYDYDSLFLIEVKVTLVNKEGLVASSKLEKNKQKKLIGQLQKYREYGFQKLAVVHFILGEPVNYFDENGPIENIWAWIASTNIPDIGSESENRKESYSEGDVLIPHVLVSVGVVPGQHESGSGSTSCKTRWHRIKDSNLRVDVKSALVQKLQEVLPTVWGVKDDTRWHPMPIVRECETCEKLFVQHLWYNSGKHCSNCIIKIHGHGIL